MLHSSRDEPIMRYEVEKYGYISGAFAKHPLMIKLNGIQLKYIENEFNLRIVFGMRVVCTFAFGLCGFL